MADLHTDVKEAIDTNSKRQADDALVFSRQKVASFLRSHVNTRVSGFLLQEGLGRRNPKTGAQRRWRAKRARK
jgi:hypothetical protein